MRIEEKVLRSLIREVLVTITSDEAHGASAGKHIKGSTVSSTAEKRIGGNPALVTALENIKTSGDLAATLQAILDVTTSDKGGIDQPELKTALQKLLKTALDVKP